MQPETKIIKYMCIDVLDRKVSTTTTPTPKIQKQKPPTIINNTII